MRRYFRWIFGFYRPHRVHLAFLVLLTLVSATVALAFPLVFRYLLQNMERVLTAEGGEFSRFLQILGAVALGRIVAGFYPGARAWLNSKIGVAVRDRVFASTMEKDYRFFNRFRPGDIATRLTDDITEYPRIAWFSCSAIFRAVESVSRLLFCLAVMVWMSWELTLLALVPLPLMLFIFYRVEHSLGRRIDESRRATSRTGELLDSTFAGIPIIKAYRAEKGQAGRLRRLLDRRFEIDLGITRLVMVVESVYVLIGEIGKVTVLLVGGLFVVKERLGIGDLYAFYVYLDMLLAPMMDIPNLFVTSKQAFASIDREQEILDFPSGRVRAEGADPGRIREVSLEGAGFSYGPGCGVSGVSLSVKTPATVAVVGEVGSGKSTLLRMLAGLLPVTEGSVRLNGLPIEDIGAVHLARETGYVPQESMLFSESVEDNILLGRPISREMLHRALELADMPPEDLSAGIDTRLGQGGSGVSGGQRQRVAIAMALAAGPSLCLFDDCTAALDADLEERFWKGMEGGERIVFVVTHREATARRADRVLFLHEGRVNDEGTHEELLRRNGLYRMVLAARAG